MLNSDFDVRPSSRARNVFMVAGCLALALSAGCANVHNIEVGSIPDDYRTTHPIIVDEGIHGIDLPIVSSDVHLSLSDRKRIRTLADGFRKSGSDSVQVLLPKGSTNEYAAERVSHQVVAELIRSGVRRDRVFVQPYSAVGEVGPSPIRVSYAALVAHTGPCGRWPEDLADTSENKHYENFGCATQHNLAAQIADPNDLLTPRGMDPIDAGRRTNVIDGYRRGDATVSAPISGGIASY